MLGKGELPPRWLCGETSAAMCLLGPAFSYGERRYLEFRFEGFNFANHPNFGHPNASLTSNAVTAAIPGTGSFGTISSLRSGINMRELQFSLKLVF